MDGFLAFSRVTKNVIQSIFGTIAALTLLILTVFAMAEIIRRYIFGVVFSWGQDAIIVGMVSAVALYMVVTQVRRGHLVMGVAVEMLHARGYFRAVGLIKILISAIVFVFCATIGITGWSTMTYAIERNLTTYSLVLPQWPFYAILIAGFLGMALVAFLQLVEDIISFARGEHLDGNLNMTTDV